MARTKQTARVSSSIREPSPSPASRLSVGGVFSKTLQTITTTKLEELSKNRSRFEEQKASIIASAQSETDQVERLRLLIDGVKSTTSDVDFYGIGTHPLRVKINNIIRFLDQARYDPSVSSKLMQEWEAWLIQRLYIKSLKYEYGSLYGKLVTEWLSEEEQPAEITGGGTTEESSSYAPISAADEEKLLQRRMWEENVFTSIKVDDDALRGLLNSLFGQEANKQSFKALQALRDSVKEFEVELAEDAFHIDNLHWVIAGLLSSDLLTDEKRTVLEDMDSNPVILSEIADVLNMRYKSLETWDWEGDILLDQRRRINGTYKIYMQEDLLHAIFLQFIGVKWSVFFKTALVKFSKFDGAWTSLRTPISKIEKKRREYYLGRQSKKPSVVSKRQGMYFSYYFVSRLLNSEDQEIENVDGEEEAETMPLAKKRKRTSGAAPRKQLASKAARKSVSSSSVLKQEKDHTEYNEEDSDGKSPMELKQTLLHLLSTDILFNTYFHGEITVLHSQFDSWSQTISHSTILEVFAYFGVSPKWISFFQKFLEAPLKFSDDYSKTSTRIRKRGVPESHILSDVFSEVVMFCMDYSVNQKTSGNHVYRLQDDLWFWSKSHDDCIKAWDAMTQFADIIGVSLDEDKSGTVRIHSNKEDLPMISSTLPSGPVRWGFLYLDSDTGRFLIDQSLLDIHVVELRNQLSSKSGSIFAWIQAWNTYAGTFFATNFGAPAHCYGREHVDDILSTLERIQRDIFSAEDSDETSENSANVASYLKAELSRRFNISDVPSGFLYLPTSLGGLELKSPFIPFLAIRDDLPASPVEALKDFSSEEEDAYRNAKTAFENEEVPRFAYEIDDPKWKPESEKDRQTFFSFEEFCKWREEFSSICDSNLSGLFEGYLDSPTEKSVSRSDLDTTWLKFQGWQPTTPYWWWVLQLYGPEISERFGGLSVVETGWLPIGMVGLFRSGRVKWQG